MGFGEPHPQIGTFTLEVESTYIESIQFGAAFLKESTLLLPSLDGVSLVKFQDGSHNGPQLFDTGIRSQDIFSPDFTRDTNNTPGDLMAHPGGTQQFPGAAQGVLVSRQFFCIGPCQLVTTLGVIDPNEGPIFDNHLVVDHFVVVGEGS